MTFAGLADGHTATIEYTPSEGKDADTYDNGSYDETTFKVVDGEGTDVTGQYTLGDLTKGKLIITKPSVTDVVEPLELEKVYDGTPLYGGIKAKEGVPEEVLNELKVKYSWTWLPDPVVYQDDPVSVIDFTNGAIRYTVHVSGDNFTPGIMWGTLKITKAPLTITVIDQEYPYNGAPQGENNKTYTAEAEIAEKVTVETLKGGDKLNSITLNGQETAVGEYTDKIVASDGGVTYGHETEKTAITDNYTVTYVPGKLTITKLAVTVTITGSRESKPYNGEEQKTEGYEVEISDPVYTEADFTGPDEAVAKGKNVGAYEMGLKEEQFTNINDNFDVTFSVMDGELKITAVSLTVTAASDSKVYDGTPLTAPTATAAPLQGSDRLGSVTVTGTITDVGTVPNVPSDAMIVNADGADVSGNYIITYVNGTLTINPVREYTITVRGNSATRTYNGAAQSVSGYTFSAFDESITITRQLAQDDPKATASGTGVGTYRMTMSAADFEATSDKYDVIRFVVIPGTLRITAVPDDDDEEIIDPDVPLAAPATGLGSQVGECFE